MKHCLLALPLLLSGCIPALIGAGTETAVVVAQERSVGSAVDDAGINININKKLAEAGNSLFAKVSVKSVEGRVLLAGSVTRADDQVEAVRIAWQVEGVKEVINEIQINDQSDLSDYARDAWISTQIKSRLIFVKDVRSINYSIITVNQTVYIMGLAQDPEELNRVTYVASTTNYVKRVVSYARLKTDPRRGYTPQP